MIQPTTGDLVYVFDQPALVTYEITAPRGDEGEALARLAAAELDEWRAEEKPLRLSTSPYFPAGAEVRQVTVVAFRARPALARVEGQGGEPVRDPYEECDDPADVERRLAVIQAKAVALAEALKETDDVNNLNDLIDSLIEECL